MTLPLQNKHAELPTYRDILSQTRDILGPSETQGQVVGGGEHRYLLCNAILRGVDCHELSVFVVLLSAGCGPTIDHNLRRKATLRGCFRTCHSAVEKTIFSKRPPIILIRALKFILYITATKFIFLNETLMGTGCFDCGNVLCPIQWS